ncbi:MAG: phosphatase PAP2 family protein [Muribaculaceae bacterium]|nr:phosphatase PAP2 family protein [Muribaculaceae bacterium]MDE6322188.1 phosphatase PAP2 family protein [Muribaculaceae bacterium]
MSIIEYIADIDTKIFLALNGMHAQWLDPAMWMMTGRFFWVPLYALLLWWLYKRYQWREATVYLLAVVLTIVIADQVCGGALRGYIGRLRPANPDNPISGMVHIVNGYRGGSFGFPSCHGANSFGLAVIMSLIMKRRWFTICIIIWALLNSYTRIYLGVHYPGDILVGATFGSLAAWGMYRLARCVIDRWIKVDKTAADSVPDSCGPRSRVGKCGRR